MKKNKTIKTADEKLALSGEMSETIREQILARDADRHKLHILLSELTSLSRKLHELLPEFSRLGRSHRFSLYGELEFAVAGICHALNHYHKALPYHYEEPDEHDCITCALIWLTEETGENPLEVFGQMFAGEFVNDQLQPQEESEQK
jgi:hypothetical protein